MTPDSIGNFEDVISGAEKKIDEFLKTHFKGYVARKPKVVFGGVPVYGHVLAFR